MKSGMLTIVLDLFQFPSLVCKQRRRSGKSRATNSEQLESRQMLSALVDHVMDIESLTASNNDMAFAQLEPVAAPVMYAVAPVSLNTQPIFQWTGPAEIVGYELWLSNRDAKTRPIYEQGLTETSYAVAAPLNPAKYAVWVRGTLANGSQTDWSALTEFEVLAPPTHLTSGGGDSKLSRPALAWEAVPGATGYDVRILVADSTTVVYKANNVAGLSHTVLQDLPAGKLTVFVRAVKGNRPFSAWGAGDALWLKLPPKNLRLTATGVAWDAVPFAASYTFELRDVRGNLAVPVTTVSVPAFDPPVPLNPGQYTLRVYSNFSNLSSNWSGTQPLEVFRAPVRITSSSAATVDATPFITWEAAPSATSYEIVVTRPGSGTLVYERRSIIGTSFRVDVPLAIDTYQIQVRAHFADGSRSSLSPIQLLRIGPAPILTYADGVVSWNAVNQATNYELWINYLGSPIQGKIVYQQLYVGTSYALPSTLPKGPYQTWLRAIRAENGELHSGAWRSVMFDFA